jgi:hypothetical protein
VIGRDESGLGLRTAIVAAFAGTTLLAGNAIADFNDAVVVRYQVEATEADGTPVSVTVEDLYLLTDDPKDVDLNIYDVFLPASGQVHYFQSQTGPGWTPTNLGGPFDTTALRYADSFVTVGGFDFGTTAPPQAPGAGGASAIDPFFGGNDVAYPIDRAGWYNSSPPNLQGIAGQTPAGLGVLIGRFAYDGDFTIVGTQLWATWNQGIGTDGFQEEFTVREFIDCNGNIVEDAAEIANPNISPYAGATQWAGKKGNGHWYAFIDQELTHDEAAAWAGARGGYLATFAEPGEKEFLLSLTEPFCCGNYVGGHQLNPGLEPAGSWVWDTGEPWSGVEWATNEPNDASALSSGSEQYLVMFTFAGEFGRFNDNNGENPRTFIVEWDDAADCNGNGVLDCCEIVEGSETDRNGNRVPDSCEALIVPDAFATIQSAVDAVPDGGLILVRPGVYNEHVDFGFGSATRQFVLASTDGAQSTVIEGSPDVEESVLLVRSGFDHRTRIDGFTIRGGRNGHQLSNNFTAGGGIFIANNSPSIWNCRFLSNTAPSGGNLYALAFDGDLRDCVFSGGFANFDGGNVMVQSSDCVIAACSIADGSANNDGGGIKVVDGFVDLLECSIQANNGATGGGVMYYETPGTETELHFVGSTARLNSAEFGGGFWSSPNGNGPFLGTSVVCDNTPDNFFGPYTDLGDNEICVCVGDLNLDGQVNGTDLGLFLVYAGSDCEPGASCPGDLNNDGEISGADLGIMLGNWGLCQ